MVILLAGLHYIALALGFGSLVLRGIRLRECIENSKLKPVFIADNFWGLAAVLWIGTGLLRAFGGFEKGSEFYLQSHWFALKMTLLGILFLLEIFPMVALIRWRIAKKTKIEKTDLKWVRRFYGINDAQTVIILVIPFVAVAMARGI